MAKRGSISNTMHTEEPSKNARLTSSKEGSISAIHVGDVESEIINLLESSASCLMLLS